MKYTIVLLFLSFSIAFGQNNFRNEEIAFKIKNFNKLSSNDYAPTVNQLNYDVKYYGLNLNINPANRYINGNVKITLKALASIDKVELNLTKDFIIDSIFNGLKRSAFVYSGDMLTVNLDKSLQQNDIIELSIYYQGYPGSSGFGSFGCSDVNGKKLVWTLSEPFGARDWWPCKDYPYDKADSADINITIPKEMIVASNGTLRNTVVDGNNKTYYWHEGYPISTYLISATAYEYNTFSNYYKYTPTDSMEIQYFTVMDKFNPRYEQYELVPKMIKIFSDMYGQYPFINEKYGQAEFPWGGGMEHQTCTSLGSFGEIILAHELSHQWWGDMITCKDFHNIWLNEGFATYSEALYAEKAYGKSNYFSEMRGTKYMGNGTIYVDDLTNISRVFSSDLTYNKASWVLHMLRHTVGDDIFFNILKKYYKSIHQYDAVNTEEFRKICEAEYGKDLNWFFHEWIYEEFYPQYQYQYSKIKNGNNTDIKLSIGQKQKNYIFKMPIDINIATSFGDTTIVVYDSLQSQTFNMSINGDVNNLELDKEEWILRTTEKIASNVSVTHVTGNYELRQNYPNPFNPGTEISFYLPKDDIISLKVFDILGKEIVTLFDGRMEQGNHKIDFNSNRLPGGLTSGLYFYKLTGQNFSAVKKMAFIK